ncbi:MAG TPA: FkbM family methyltransferase [Flavisolibacter sp.]
MKHMIRQLLVDAGRFEHLRYSIIYKWYARLFKPNLRQQYVKELNFYSSFLEKCPIIFDIGANDGHKTEVFLQFADTVVCLEPEPANFKTLQVRFRNRMKRVILLQKAAADADGEMPFYIHHPGSAFNTLSNKFRALAEKEGVTRFNEQVTYEAREMIGTTTLDRLITEFGQPCFIKVDTEGFELRVLKGLSRPVRFISLEYMLPDFKDELLVSLDILESQFPGALSFNVAIDEELVFPHFSTAAAVRAFAERNEKFTLELIVRNSSAAR